MSPQVAKERIPFLWKMIDRLEADKRELDGGIAYIRAMILECEKTALMLDSRS